MVAQKSKMQMGPADFLTGIEPIGKHKSTTEMVYLALKEAIANGDLKPGQRLVEQKLSDKMRVSRVPVRDAIKRLEQGGLAQRLPARGTVVKKISEDDVDEAFEIRAILESFATAQASKHATGGLLASLEGNIQASSEALNRGDVERATSFDDQFHEMIYKATKSGLLTMLIHTLMDYTARNRKPLFRSRQVAQASLDGHRAIVEAMRRGGKQDVEAIVKSHILRDRLLDLEYRTDSAVNRQPGTRGQNTWRKNEQ